MPEIAATASSGKPARAGFVSLHLHDMRALYVHNDAQKRLRVPQVHQNAAVGRLSAAEERAGIRFEGE